MRCHIFVRYRRVFIGLIGGNYEKWHKTRTPPAKKCIITAILLSFVCATAMSCGDDKKSTEEDACVTFCADETTALICVAGELVFTDCGDKKCYDGACVAATNQACTNESSECVGDISYRVCGYGFWSDIIPCSGDKVCQAGKCVAKPNGPQKESCTATQPECSPDNKGYRVCVSGVWSDVIECTGTTVCKNGQCVGEDVTSKLPCATVGEQRCVSKSRVQICDTNNYWLFTDCPKDVPICDESINECVPSQCTDGDVKCDDNSTLATCVDFRWTKIECPEDKPLCKDKKCQPAPKECTPGHTKCLSERQAYKCDSNGYWKSSLCTGDDFCHNGECVECIDGNSKCANDHHNLMTCKDGKYVKEDCPLYHYCPINENKCVEFTYSDSCSGSFSFCRFKSFDDRVILCTTNGKIGYLRCSSDGCEYALDGIGSTCAGDTDNSVSPCTAEGASSTSIVFKGDRNHKADCAVCKYSTSGKLRWMPVDKSYCE